MSKIFEDAFVDVQAELISLCLEIAPENIDKVYAYCSFESDGQMFNSFFSRNQKVLTLGDLGCSKSRIFQFLEIGAGDLKKVMEVCRNYEMPLPSEMKLIYDVKTRSLEAQYQYERLAFSEGDIRFLDWIENIKQKSN